MIDDLFEIVLTCFGYACLAVLAGIVVGLAILTAVLTVKLGLAALGL